MPVAKKQSNNLLRFFRGKQELSAAEKSWRLQSREQKSNKLYSYADFYGGGRLVEAYNNGGKYAVRQIVLKEFPLYLYEQGRGALVEELEFATWKRMIEDKFNNTKLLSDMSDSDILAYTRQWYAPFTPHQACWRLKDRGAVGETVLHLCFLQNTPVHAAIARVILQCFPLLAVDFYEGDAYFGESCLHLAIVNNDLDSVKTLIKLGVNIHQRAGGTFFIPEDQKKKRSKFTDYEGYAYYGEFPLSFAASFGSEDIYDYLLECGADSNAADAFGNTALHMMVIHNQHRMYSHAIKKTKNMINPWQKNEAGFTALSLSCRLGRTNMFEEILKHQRIHLWTFSNVDCSYYPLQAIDSIGPGGAIGWNSALMLIVKGTDEAHLKMLQNQVVVELLQEKWKAFAKKWFFIYLGFLVVHLIALSGSVYLRRKENFTYDSSDPRQRGQIAFEVILVLTCLITIVFNLIEAVHMGLFAYQRNWIDAPSRMLFNVSTLMILCCIGIRISSMLWHPASPAVAIELGLVEDEIFALAIPLSWSYLLFFAKGGHDLTGQAVMMFYKIISTVMIAFLLIFIIFLGGFSICFNILFKKDTGDRQQIFYNETVLILFQMAFGEVEYQLEDDIGPLTKFVSFIYLASMPILLLNMLIAMMGNTFQSVMKNADLEWLREWAKSILVIEHGFSSSSLLRFLKKYSDEIPDKLVKSHTSFEEQSDKVEHRGLMVMKRMSKTQARTSYEAVANWKWLVKETLILIMKLRGVGHDGDIFFRDLFPDPGELRKEDAEEQYRRYSVELQGHLMFRAGAVGDAGSHRVASMGRRDSLGAAVEQVAWEKGLAHLHRQSIISSIIEETSQEEEEVHKSAGFYRPKHDDPLRGRLPSLQFGEGEPSSSSGNRRKSKKKRKTSKSVIWEGGHDNPSIIVTDESKK